MRTRILVLVFAAIFLAGFLPTLDETAAQQPKPSKADLDDAFSKGAALYKQGKTAEAIRHLERAAELAPQVFGPDDVNTASILNTLASRYVDLGRSRDAEP